MSSNFNQEWFILQLQSDRILASENYRENKLNAAECVNATFNNELHF